MQVAFVTGSRKGIGFSIGKKLAESGFRVIFSGSTPENRLGETADMISELPNSCYYLPCDVAKEEDRKRALKYILEKEDRLDILVNNAGVAPLERLDILDTTEESFDRVLRINLLGTFFMCQEVARIMIRLKKKQIEEYKPKIINISSISAYTSSVNRPEYCISKAGIAMVTTLFADRLAEEGIRVFEVRPGIIATDMTKGVHEKYENMIEGGLLPIRQFGKPEDVGDAVLAACSGLLDYTTGQVLNADGGFHIRRL